MRRPRLARQDRGNEVIVAAWRTMGATVLRIDPAGDRHQKGAPDYLVGYRGIDYLIELKAPGKPPLPEQETWHAKWRGNKVRVASSITEALSAIGVELELCQKMERGAREAGLLLKDAPKKTAPSPRRQAGAANLRSSKREPRADWDQAWRPSHSIE